MKKPDKTPTLKLGERVRMLGGEIGIVVATGTVKGVKVYDPRKKQKRKPKQKAP